LHESQRDLASLSPGHVHLEAYSFDIAPDDDVMVALNRKRAEILSRISILQTASQNWEPELMLLFHQRVLQFEAETQSLSSDPALVVISGFQSLIASQELFQSLFHRESEVIAKFQDERYGKIIEELFKRIGLIMNRISMCAQDHRQRIQCLQQLRSEYSEMAADGDRIFHIFQARIKDVNADIEDIQASIQRCYDNPQSISIIQRIPFGFDSFASELKSKNFRGSVAEHQKRLQAKADQKLKRAQFFYKNSSYERKSTLDSLKSDADSVVSDAQKLLELYLNDLNQPLDAPLKASQEFCEWFRSRLAGFIFLCVNSA
jgi:hypothetical protein